MQSEVERREIPYFEYRAINQVVHGHIDELGDTLQAIIAFGPLVTRGDTHDIDLLEIVKGWQGPSKYQAASSPNLPLRGNLYFNFVSSDDLHRFAANSLMTEDNQKQIYIQKLMEDVLEGYEVVYESPVGFVRDMLQAAIAAQKKRDGGDLLSNPLSLPSGMGRK